MNRPLSELLALGAALLFWGCPGSLENPERFGECDAEVLLARTCGSETCHDADEPLGGLDLVSPGIAGRVIDVSPGLCISSGNYVDSADPLGASFLLEKLEGTPSCGLTMPLPPLPPLKPAEVDCITAWVTEITGGGGMMDSGPTDGGGVDAAGDAAYDAAGDAERGAP